MVLASYYVTEVSQVSVSIPSGSMGSLSMCQRNDEYHQASSRIKIRQRHVHTVDSII
ncbi:hypothetical protein F383_27383 [Gossypium arboreum]|uniref:Uncharacterized protein n=1 Tax=Gossypium arboreum TaxID=29729 RepID=A0A0B0P3Z9_GOSAR|nr:hypothetical protein F383_27383 [Gossypium arboreum]